VGVSVMDDKNKTYNHIILEGCGVVALLAVMVLVGALILFFNLDRKEAQYPGSVPIPIISLESTTGIRLPLILVQRRGPWGIASF
jgi:hypothetical protein